MSRQLKFGNTVIDDNSPMYVIAEIGNNHQGDLDKAKELFKAAKDAGADAVKLQKRDNLALFTQAAYDAPYDNPNSFTGFTAARYDEQLSFSVSARFPINARINGFAQISHLDNDSNIPVYDYDQNRILFGVEFSQQRNR